MPVRETCPHLAPPDRSGDVRSAPIALAELPLLERLDHASGPKYVCPGESQPISRAVHLARLAAFYPKCRTCPHVEQVGGLPQPQPADPPASQQIACLQRDGLRGVHHNTCDRLLAGTVAERLGTVLWERVPRRGRSVDELPGTPSAAAAPTVVVGRDARPSSPDIAAGIVPGLRRMGCHVVELGHVSRPAVDFAVYHLRASAGVHVTGAGHPPAWTGLDLIGHSGEPWSASGGLLRLIEGRGQRSPRPTRIGGTLRTFDVETPLRADFHRRLHGATGVRIGVFTECPAQRRGLGDWWGPLGDSVVAWDDPRMRREATDWSREERRSWREEFQRRRLQLAVQVADDGRAIRVLDEHARPLPATTWLVRLVEHLLIGAAPRRVVVSSELPPLARGRLLALGAEVLTAEPDFESLVRKLIESEAVLATDGAGRIWLRDHYPVCDGLVTAILLMQLARNSASPVSHWGA